MFSESSSRLSSITTFRFVASKWPGGITNNWFLNPVYFMPFYNNSYEPKWGKKLQNFNTEQVLWHSGCSFFKSNLSGPLLTFWSTRPKWCFAETQMFFTNPWKCCRPLPPMTKTLASKQNGSSRLLQRKRPQSWYTKPFKVRVFCWRTNVLCRPPVSPVSCVCVNSLPLRLCLGYTSLQGVVFKMAWL